MDHGEEAALGLRAHSGWAVLVAIGGPLSAPAVIARSRIELVRPEIPRSAQPYHAAAEMQLADAEAFLARCAQAAHTLAATAIGEALADLSARGLRPAACAVLLAAGRPLPNLPSILASHPAIHTAEGEFFRNALKSAAGSHGLAVTGIKERELLTRAAARLRISADRLTRRAAEMGKTCGPPWRQDEKLSALAAWLALAERA